MAENETYKVGEHPDQSPPITTIGVVGWMRANLFSSPLNIALTAFALYLIYLVVPPIVSWGFATAVFTGDTRQRCDMGRQLTRLGVVISQVDPARAADPDMAKPTQEVQDFLGQFAKEVADKQADFPAELSKILETLDPVKTNESLAKAFKSGDVEAINGNFQALAPLVDWGSVRQGACWTFINIWKRQIMYGRYPVDQIWRVNLAFLILIVTAVPLFIPQVKRKGWIGAFLLLVYPIIALYLFSGFSRANADEWPYRLMGYSAVLLALISLLPYWVQKFEARVGAVAVALILLLPVWGLATGSTWTAGLIYGAPTWSAVLAVLFAGLPIVALAAGSMAAGWRDFIAAKQWEFSIGVGFLALIGFTLPVLAWEELAGPSPPWPIFVAPAMFAVVAAAGWGYRGGLASLLGKLLLPIYLIVSWIAVIGPPDFLNFGILDWTANTTPFFRGFEDVLPFVETPLWGGLFLTLVIGGTGIVASLPIGVVLALGRRSNMPVVRSLCVAFIELWRGVPLISVLFMASVMFPLFLPEGMNFDKLVRALIGVALFSSAYMAEVVRGGLQAISKGQYEAAEAAGLTYWKSMNLVILPQALKLVIPGIVNTFIGLFKDTTLVLIIGLFDLLGAVQLAATNQRWLGFSVEGYVFAAFGFWVFCFSMSRYSIHVERKLETGHKR